jgi:hypothetical protein
VRRSLSNSEKLPFILTGENKLLCSKASQAAVIGSWGRGLLVIALRPVPPETASGVSLDAFQNSIKQRCKTTTKANTIELGYKNMKRRNILYHYKRVLF